MHMLGTAMLSHSLHDHYLTCLLVCLSISQPTVKGLPYSEEELAERKAVRQLAQELRIGGIESE